ncbi:MAG: penicillin acylase family protein [Actinomycetota bacterium]|nr:penicillin acylase family protein [Actinomycetota bacterium]
MLRGVLVWGAVALLLAVPGTASAKVERAGDILPPGQSGHVTLAGLPNGEGSPHLTDQVERFLAFDFKPHGFDNPAQSTETPRPGVIVERDDWGVPTIRGQNDYDIWFGAGYAVAQDRLFQLELFRRATQGRLAEIVGRSYVEDDITVRRDFYTGPELDAQVASLPEAYRARFTAYADGVNAWIQQVRSDPNKLPAEFAVVNASPPADWTVRDSAAIGVFLARTVPSDDGEEMANWKALSIFGPKLFDRVLPIRTKGQVPSVPAEEGSFPAQPGRSRRQEAEGFRRSQRFLKTVPMPKEEDVGGTHAARSLPMLGQLGMRGSNMWAIRDRDGGASLFNGPQLGFQIPELFVEFELHRPGYDIRGVTAPGVPLVGIGHNGRVAWGFTSGLTDEDDVYVEKLTGPEKYVFKGEERQMECRDETFSYRSPPSDATSILDLEPSPPESGSETRRLCRTVHGPVQGRADGVAFSRRYAIWMREFDTLEGLAEAGEADTVFEIDRAMAKVTWNENFMAADDSGNIGYWHPGNLPIKPRGYDERLPFPGTGEAEWKGFLSVEQRPHVINPKQGWLVNWNNVPSAGWTQGDIPARERLLGPYHRAKILSKVVARAHANGGGYEQTRNVDRITGTTAQQRPVAAGPLNKALAGATGNAKTLLEVIKRWNGSYHEQDANGTVDPGVAAWVAFGEGAVKVAFGKLWDHKELGLLGTGAGSSHAFEMSNVKVYALRKLTVKGWRQAAKHAFNSLAARFGTTDTSKWRDKRRMYNTSAQGAASFPDIPFFDRGTWQHVVELGP